MDAILCSWDVMNGYLQANVIINTPSGWVYQYIDTPIKLNEDMIHTLKEALQGLKAKDSTPAGDVYTPAELEWYKNSRYKYACAIS